MLIFLNINSEWELMNMIMNVEILNRQLMIESHGITIIRSNPDAADFDILIYIHAHY